MAFPQVAATNSGSQNTASTSPTINLPASISAGDLLLAYVVTVSGTASITDWTELNNFSGGASRVITVLGKVASGSEGGTATATTSNVKSAHATWRTTGWFGGLTADSIAFGTAATGSNANPNPPDLNPANWDVEDTLYVAMWLWDAEIAQSSYPTNYTIGQVTARTTGTGGDCGMGVAGREVAAASENPGTATIGATVGWAAQTMAIRPAAASPSVAPGVGVATWTGFASTVTGGGGGVGQPTTRRFGGVPFTRGDSGLWVRRW